MIFIFVFVIAVLITEGLVADGAIIREGTGEMQVLNMFHQVCFLSCCLSTDRTNPLRFNILYCIWWEICTWNIQEWHCFSKWWFLDTWTLRLFLDRNVDPQNLQSYENESGKWTVWRWVIIWFFCPPFFKQIVHWKYVPLWSVEVFLSMYWKRTVWSCPPIIRIYLLYYFSQLLIKQIIFTCWHV